MSDTLTRGVRIIVMPSYLFERSDPSAGRYLFAYQVMIHNAGEVPVQLRSRHWVITDGEGHVEEVRGPGVVGCQPRLAPGESFTYGSGCPLPTPIGTMHGSFQMVTDEGEGFDARIAPFRLAVPGILN